MPTEVLDQNSESNNCKNYANTRKQAYKEIFVLLFEILMSSDIFHHWVAGLDDEIFILKLYNLGRYAIYLYVQFTC